MEKLFKILLVAAFLIMIETSQAMAYIGVQSLETGNDGNSNTNDVTTTDLNPVLFPKINSGFEYQQADSLSDDAETTEGVLVYFHLEFFNRFNDGDSKLFTEAFRRYHLLTVNYSEDVWDLQLLYNWCDNVIGAVSVHEFTPWGFQARYRLNEADSVAANYIYVNDLTDKGNNNSVARVDYTHNAILDSNWRADFRVGAKLVDNNFFNAVWGAELGFKNQYHIGINYLNALDDCLMNDYDHSSYIPVEIGTAYQLNEHTWINLDLYGFTKKPENRPGLWFVTSFRFTLWE